MQALCINTHEGPTWPASQSSEPSPSKAIPLIAYSAAESALSVDRSVYQSNLLLFEEETVLLEGPYTLRAAHPWPFTFTFPHQSDNTAAKGLFKISSSLFNEDDIQAIPPSCQLTSTSLRTNDVDTSIRYKLEAVLESPLPLGASRVTKQLSLVTQRNIVNPDPQLLFQSQTFSVQSLHLSPAFEDREPSLKARMKASITSAKAPKAQYQLNILLPSVGLGISYGEDHSTTTTPPPVLLTHVSLTLVSTARTPHARLPHPHLHSPRALPDDSSLRSSSSSSSTPDAIDKGTPDILYQNHTFPHLRLSEKTDIARPMDLRIPSRIRPPIIAPTFRCPNVSCAYALKVHVSVECGRQRRVHKFKSPEFLLLAGDCAPDARVEARGEVVVLVRGRCEGAPPSYEEVK
ncbi:MAG: hypothetical protein LQ348_006620 [Seirophora lacunosa]|nr:MAG: hypothetical protein LQ348_006620 [Seirophora lacunosa]